MPFERILPGQWMHISKDLRDHLVGVFGLKRTGATEVRDQEVISDGHTFEDLMAITKEKMFEYIGSEETFLRAWELTVAKAYSELHPPVATIQPTPAKTVEDVPAPEPTPVVEPTPAPTPADLSTSKDITTTPVADPAPANETPNVSKGKKGKQN